MTCRAGDADFSLKGHIQRGDYAPWWNQGRYKFVFDSVGGRYVVMNFCGSIRDAHGQSVLHAARDLSHFVVGGKACFFAVCTDPENSQPNIEESFFPVLRFLWDSDSTVSRAYGTGSARVSIVLDPMLRVLEVIPFRPDGMDAQQLAGLLERLPEPSRYLGFEIPVPVLILPRVFEPEFCAHLIDCFEAHGGRESGFMQMVNDMAVEMHDPRWKRRRDYTIEDKILIDQIKLRMGRRASLMMQKAFQFKLSRMERHLIACYLAADGGHFGPHRDDTVRATEHRRFAISINLNDDFDGGEVSFPEFSPRTFKAPIGAALIFSGSLLHCVSQVTRGRRYAFLPFVHDEEAEKIRLANLRFLSPAP